MSALVVLNAGSLGDEENLMHQGHPHYLLHYGPPSSRWSAEWGYPYPYTEWPDTWVESSPDWEDWGYYPEPRPYVGFDVSSIPGAAVEWGHKLGEQIGEFGSAAGEALRKVGRGIGGAMPSFPSIPSIPSLAPIGSAAQKAGTAADATTLAAEEARRSIAHVSQRADRTLDQIDRTAKEHEETVRVVKYVMVGIAVLGGAALIYSIAK